MKIDIDLEKQISDAVANAIAPEKIGALIQKNVSEVVEASVKSAFSYSSPFKKLVETSISQLMPHELKLDKQADWNHFVTQAINQRLTDFNCQRMQEVIAPVLDELLVTPPESIKLSDLLKSIVQYWRANDDYNGTPWMEIETSTGLIAGHQSIYIAKNTPRSKYSADIHIRTNEGRVWGVAIKEMEMGKAKFAGPFFNLEEKLFQLYACKTKLEIDVTSIDDVDLEFEEYEED